MAIKLAERAVASMVALYTNSMPTVIAAIDTERGDFTLPQATSADIYDYPLRERGTHASSVLVEVFEDGSIEFDHPYADASAQRAVYDMPLTVRVTVFNTAQWSEAQMHTIRRRYEAALKILMIENHDMDDADDSTQIASLEALESGTEGEDGIELVTASASVVVRCEEC